MKPQGCEISHTYVDLQHMNLYNFTQPSKNKTQSISKNTRPIHDANIDSRKIEIKFESKQPKQVRLRIEKITKLLDKHTRQFGNQL